MAAYRRVYDSCHLQADCQEPGSAPVIEYRLRSFARNAHLLVVGWPFCRSSTQPTSVESTAACPTSTPTTSTSGHVATIRESRLAADTRCRAAAGFPCPPEDIPRPAVAVIPCRLDIRRPVDIHFPAVVDIPCRQEDVRCPAVGPAAAAAAAAVSPCQGRLVIPCRELDIPCPAVVCPAVVIQCPGLDIPCPAAAEVSPRQGRVVTPCREVEAIPCRRRWLQADRVSCTTAAATAQMEAPATPPDPDTASRSKSHNCRVYRLCRRTDRATVHTQLNSTHLDSIISSDVSL